MPIYEYECAACGDKHEFIQKFSEGPKRKCPSCGRLRLRKAVTAAAFHLKGGGWYVTDFRDKDKGKAKKPEGDGAEKTAASSDGSKPDGAAAKPADQGDGKSKGDAKAGGKSDGQSGGKSDGQGDGKGKSKSKGKDSGAGASA